MPEILSRTWQAIPTPEWELVRERLPGYSIVMRVDDERQVREFLILDPQADCTDMDLDGRTLSAAEAKELLEAQAVRPIPAYLEEELRLPWATRS